MYFPSLDYLICLWRSLFTPYFKYLLEGSIQYLSEDDALGGSKHKKKKTKLVDVQVEQKDKLLGLKLWNLRALVLKSLHQCFLYDNDQKILDSSNFQVSWFIVFLFFVADILAQKKVHGSDLSCSVVISYILTCSVVILCSYDIDIISAAFNPCRFPQWCLCILIHFWCLQVLLKPIVSQFVVEPPKSVESVLDAPSIEEVDETIILCLGQMAVTARTDVLWKPLNHEVRIS